MTPTFSYDNPLPPDDRFGVLSCLKVKRQHARLFANATAKEREEAKAYSAFALERLGWTRSKVPSPDKFLSEDHLDKYRLIVRGAADYTEQVAISTRVGDPYSLDLYAGIAGNETLETNPDQADPLTRTCLEEHDCECHRTLPGYFEGRHPHAPDCIDLSSSSPLEEGSDADDPVATVAPVDKGKGVDRTPASSPHDPFEGEKSEELEQLDAVLFYEALIPSKYDSSNKRRGSCEPGPSRLPLQANSSSSCPKSVKKAKAAMRATAGSSCPKTSITTVVNTPEGYTCQWSRYFGGDCRDTFTVAQSLDRHLVTHIPDEEGYQITLYRCTVKGCGTGCARPCSLMRHIRQEHGETDDVRDLVEELERPWYWPAELFASGVMRSKSKATPPSLNTSTWDEKIQEILTRHGITTARPRQAKGAGEKDVQTPMPSSSRPPKRRRMK